MTEFNIEKNSGAFLVMVGLIVLGLMIPQAAKVFRSFERTVTVRGLCEQEVTADKVIWPVVFKVVGDELSPVNREIDSKHRFIRNFLVSGGIAESDINIGVPEISDKFADEYGGNTRMYRYVATCRITVCSHDVDKVLELMGRQAELLSNGIILSSSWDTTPQFLFEGLNEIKPDMIKEATSNARKSGEQFAKDSDSRLGNIKTANQGSFSIEDRDSNTPQFKKVRVVTTITYYLNK